MNNQWKLNSSQIEFRVAARARISETTDPDPLHTSTTVLITRPLWREETKISRASFDGLLDISLFSTRLTIYRAGLSRIFILINGRFVEGTCSETLVWLVCSTMVAGFWTKFLLGWDNPSYKFHKFSPKNWRELWTPAGSVYPIKATFRSP